MVNMYSVVYFTVYLVWTVFGWSVYSPWVVLNIDAHTWNNWGRLEHLTQKCIIFTKTWRDFYVCEDKKAVFIPQVKFQSQSSTFQ